MTYIGHQLSTYEDVSAIIGTAETTTLEFKREPYGNSDSDRMELVKDVTALANTLGGQIVIGIEEDSATNLAARIVPVSEQQVNSELLRLHSILNTGCRPRVSGVEMRYIAVPAAGYVLVVDVPKSRIGPHQVLTRQSYRFHRRNTNGTYPLEIDELRDMIVRQASFATEVRHFREARASLFVDRQHDLPLEIRSERKLLVHYLPEVSFGRPNYIDISKYTKQEGWMPLLTAAGVNPFGFDTGYTPRANLDGLVILNGRATDPQQAYIQLFDDASIEFANGGAITAAPNSKQFDHEHLEHVLFNQYQFATGMLDILGLTERVYILVTAMGVRDYTIRPQAPTRTLPLLGHSVAIGRDPAFFTPILVEDMSAQSAERALEPLIQQIWRAAAYDHAYSYLNGEYRGGSWGV